MKQRILKTLHAEVKPALGCTEPVAIALAVAKARELSTLSPDQISKITVTLSQNIYKNAMNVSIPGTPFEGIEPSIILGALCCKSVDMLNTFKSVTAIHVDKVPELLSRNIVFVAHAKTQDKVFVEARVESEQEGKWGYALITKKHDNFTKLENHNGEIEVETEKCIFDDSPQQNTLSDVKIADIFDELLKIDLDELEFLIEGVDVNMNMARFGLENECGMQVGRKLNDSELHDDLLTKSMILTAAASDARMSGVQIPVMSSNGSGNNGITALLPIAAYKALNPDIPAKKLAVACALSHLINAIIKNEIGRLSPLCGCGVAAGTGAAAALAYLMGGGIKEIDASIQNMLANTTGMICDGAKVGCALKLATSSAAAVQSAMIANKGITVPAGNGLVGENADISIKNLGVFSKKALDNADNIILNIMTEI